MQHPRDHFERTHCSCHECASHCKQWPGRMMPGDMQRIADHLGVACNETWIDTHFVASIKTRVIDWNGQGKIVPTIVPAMNDHGCVFLENGKCTIHPVSPFGCSHYDSHMRDSASDEISHYSLSFLIWAMEISEDEGYLATWNRLAQISKHFTFVG